MLAIFALQVGYGAGAVTNVSAYPGPVQSSTATYTAGDLWIGAFAEKVASTFARNTGGNSVASSEPTPELFTTGGGSTTNITVGLLYFLSASGTTGALLGTFSNSGDVAGAGAVFAAKIGGPTYNDIVAGAIVFTGTRVESYGRAYSDAPAGLVLFSGSVVESSVIRTVYADAPTGAMAFTGSVIESYGRGYHGCRDRRFGPLWHEDREQGCQRCSETAL